MAIIKVRDENGDVIDIPAFVGPKGDPGADYVLTEADKAEIAELAAELVEVPGGGNGADGFSPIATVEQTADGAVITIADKDGTTTATVTNGKDGVDGQPGKDGSNGADGVSPTVSVSKSGKVTTVSITDKNGTKTATIDDGADGNDYVLTEADKAEIAALVIEMLGGNPIFGVVDSNNRIVLNGDLPDGTYSVKYEMDNGTTVNIGNLVLDTNVYYTVTNNLTQCTNSNSSTKAVQGGSYSATISANSGYELSSVTVTMGGSPVTVSGGNITIANVTGNIVITAVAEEIKAAYTNLANPSSSDWWADSYLSSNATQRNNADYEVTNYIGPVNNGDIIRIKGIDTTGTVAEYRCAVYTSSKTLHGSYGTGTLSTYAAAATPPLSNLTQTTTNTQFTVASGDGTYWRIGGKLNGTANDVIITINEPID